jgi:hypothetical protein
MTAHLIACPACARHVRASEPTCPFCATALPDSARTAPRRRGPSERLSRAALYAVGIGGIAVAAACSSTSTTKGDDGGTTPDSESHDDFRPLPAYGIAVPDAGIDRDAADHGDAGSGDAGEPDGGIVAAYGGPGIDAGAATDGTAPGHDGGIVAAYGGPGV